MTPERWRQVESLFEAARARPATEQASFLEDACRGDEALRREVESLLAHDQSGDSFLVAAPGVAGIIAAHAGTLAGSSFGDFQVRSLLGVGGMGEVYLARDTRLNRDVALKVLPPAMTADASRRARFAREAQTLAKFSHPHIAAIYGIEEHEGRQALVLEYVPGQTLADVVAEGPLALPDALLVARQIVDALDTAHERGIIHRDLKPANIKVDADKRIKVLDFGLAKIEATGPGETAADSSATGATSTRPGTILGTPRYMSPEQARGLPVDKRADIWSFGCVLFELLTGQPAFPGSTVADTLAAVLEREPDWSQIPEGVPAQVRALVRRSLAKDPRERLRDIGDARADLNAPSSISGPLRAADTDQAHRAKQWRDWGLGALAGVVVTALAVLVWPAAAARPPIPPVNVRVDLGPEVLLGDSVGPDLAISPDGSRIVFVSNGRLATRRLDEVAVAELPGSEGAAMPFFDPSGDWVAFAADGMLRKTPVGGGAVITLCEAPSFRGGSWGDDGVIVAALGALQGLARVPSAGGTPSPLTTPSDGEVTHRWPQVLPGSRFVVFTSHYQPLNFGDATVELLTVATGARQPLRRQATFGRYVTGSNRSFLTFISGRTLFAAELDLEHPAPATAAVPILEGVADARSFGHGRLAISSSGRMLYRPPTASTLMQIDAAGLAVPAMKRPANREAPALAPDHRRLVVGSPDDLVVYDRERETEVRLTKGMGARSAIWTPDGSFVLFYDQGQIWQVPSDGAAAPRPLGGPRGGFPTSLTADGKTMVICVLGPLGQWSIQTAPVEYGPDGPRLGAVTPYLDTVNAPYARLSPDGTWMAYTASDAQMSQLSQIYVRAFPDRGRKWMVSTDGGVEPQWTPDGTGLMFLGLDGRLMLAANLSRGNDFSSGRPHVWFDRPIMRLGTPGYALDPSAAGLRVIAALPTAPAAEQADRFVMLHTDLPALIARSLSAPGDRQ